jgi:hypothetical protein
MKPRILILLLICSGLTLTSSTYPQAGKVPPFRMLMADGKVFKAENLPMGNPILLIYFSPDCEDCHMFINELLTRKAELKNVSIALITYQQVENVSKYVTKNGLYRYPNIFVGTEGNSLFLKNYYNIMTFPFVVLYNKNGDFIVKYTSKQVNVSDLLMHIKSL